MRDLLNRAIRWANQLGPIPNALVTGSTHMVISFALSYSVGFCTGLMGLPQAALFIGSSAYAFREADKMFHHWRRTKCFMTDPWYDHLGDVLLPILGSYLAYIAVKGTLSLLGV